MRSFVLLPTSTVKPPRHAAYDVTLADRRVERWAGAYRSSRKKEHPIEKSKRMAIVTINFGVNRFLGCLTMLFHVAHPVGRKDDEVSGESNDVERNDRHSF